MVDLIADLVATHAEAPPVLPAGWKLTHTPLTEWYPADEAHPSRAYVKGAFARLAIELSAMPPDVWRVGIPVLYVDDAQGLALRHVALEPRLERDVPGEENSPIGATSLYYLIQRPLASTYFERGDFEGTMKAAIPATTPLHANLFLRARERLETEAAMNALEMLFQHYCFNEEMWRCEQMLNLLPFDLEEHPRTQKLRDLLEKQIGHLRETLPDGTRCITPEATERWYSAGSPVAGIDAEYVRTAKLSLPPRFQWLIDTCRAMKYQKVAEFGSVEGISLFHLIVHAPEITWHGFESSDVAVKYGNALATKTGVAENFHLHAMDDFGSRERDLANFDAVALFEALEHNIDAGGKELVYRCMNAICVGGSLFITTPHGNWSAFDLHTRDLELAKDHINAFTPQRMQKFLSNCIAAYADDYGYKWSIKECRSISNPNIAENNQWVFARLERES